MQKIIFLAFLVGFSTPDVLCARGKIAKVATGAAAGRIAAGKRDRQLSDDPPTYIAPSIDSGYTPPSSKGSMHLVRDKSDRSQATPTTNLVSKIAGYPKAWRDNALMNRWTNDGLTLNLCPRPWLISS